MDCKRKKRHRKCFKLSFSIIHKVSILMIRLTKCLLLNFSPIIVTCVGRMCIMCRKMGKRFHLFAQPISESKPAKSIFPAVFGCSFSRFLSGFAACCSLSHLHHSLDVEFHECSTGEIMEEIQTEILFEIWIPEISIYRLKSLYIPLSLSFSRRSDTMCIMLRNHWATWMPDWERTLNIYRTNKRKREIYE